MGDCELDCTKQNSLHFKSLKNEFRWSFVYSLTLEKK